MKPKHIKIWLLFQMPKHHQFLLRNSLQLPIHIKDLTKLAQLATTQRYQQSSHKLLFMTLRRVKSKESCLNTMNKRTIIKHGTRIQVLECMTIKNLARNNLIQLVKTPFSNLKYPIARMLKKNKKHLDQELIRL